MISALILILASSVLEAKQLADHSVHDLSFGSSQMTGISINPAFAGLFWYNVGSNGGSSEDFRAEISETLGLGLDHCPGLGLENTHFLGLGLSHEYS